MRNLALGFVIVLLLLGIPLFFAIDPLFGTVSLAAGDYVLAFQVRNFFANSPELKSSRAPPFDSKA